MFLAPTPQVVEHHHWTLAFLGAAVDPHIRLALRCLARLLDYLHRGLVAMDQRLRHECLAQRLDQPAIVQFGRPDDSVGQRTPPDYDVGAPQHVFHPVQRRTVDELASCHNGD